MTSENLQIRRLDKEDLDDVVTLHGDGESTITREQLAWEFFDDLLVRDGIIVGAFDGKRLIGTQGFIPYKAVASGQPVISAKSEITLLDPAYRGRQIFQRLYELGFELCEAEGIRCIWGFTSARKPFEKVGFDFRDFLWWEYVILRPVAAWRARRSLWSFGRELDRPAITAPRSMPDQGRNAFSLVRDHAYLEHRYGRNPRRAVGIYDEEEDVLYSYGGRTPQRLWVSECVERDSLAVSIRRVAQEARRHWFAIARICTRASLGWTSVPGAMYVRRQSPTAVVFKWLGEHSDREIPSLDVEEGYTEGVA